jgi:hypothetical protein
MCAIFLIFFLRSRTSLHLAAAGRADRNGHGDGLSVRLVDRASTLSSHGMGAAYQGSNSPEPAADTHILGRLEHSARWPISNGSDPLLIPGIGFWNVSFLRTVLITSIAVVVTVVENRD